MFHAHSGWFFGKLPDGSVRVVKHVGPGEPSDADADVVFDAATWSSIVASMSIEGETAETFRKAYKAQTGKDF